MRVEFFSPIYAGTTPNPSEKWKFLRGTTQFFNFGQKAYTITHFTERNRIEVGEKMSSKPSWFGVACRVAALFTVVIPLLMLLGALIYKARNKFEMCARENILNVIPPEIQKVMMGFLGRACLQLGATNKAYLEVVDSTPALKAERVIPLLERSLNSARSTNHHGKISLFANAAKAFSLIDLPRAMSIALESITAANVLAQDPRLNIRKVFLPDGIDDFYEILAVLVSCRDEAVSNEALEAVWTVSTSILRYPALAAIIESQVCTNRGKAVLITRRAVQEIVNLDSDVAKARAISDLSKVLPLLEEISLELAEEVLIIANTLIEFKHEAIASIGKAIAKSHPERSLEIIEDAITDANNIAIDISRSKALACLVKTLVLLNLPRAEVVANTIPVDYHKNWALSAVAVALIPVDPERALALARSMLDNTAFDAKAIALAECAIALSVSNPNAALEIVTSWGSWPSSYYDDGVWPSRLYPYANPKLKALVAIGKALVRTDPLKALSLVNCYDNDEFGEVIRELAAINPQKAFELSSSKRFHPLYKAIIAKVLLATDPLKAKTLVNEICMNGHSFLLHYNEVIDAVRMVDASKAISMIKWPLHPRAQALTHFAYRYLTQ